MKKKLLNMRKPLFMKALFVLAFMAFFSTTFAQTITVTGRVMDIAAGEPLIGATIVEKGTINGVISDINGNYSINVSSGAILECSFIGMVTKELPVGSSTVINFDMESSFSMLDEVVVTGYMVQRKVDLTGSVAVVDVQELSERITTSSMSALQGSVPGLYIETSGDPTGKTRQLLIRGVNTLGNTDPLYVIDGVPTKDSNVFNYLDPNSIESMQVLKDAAAASIYGSRASNGVIIVNTKKGKDAFKVNFSSSVTISEHTRRVDYCNTEEYGIALWRAAMNGSNPTNLLNDLSARYTYDWHYDTDGNPVLDAVHSVPYVGGNTKLPATDTDWQDVIYRTGLAYQNNVVISGGTDASSLLVSFGNQRNNSVIEYNWFNKINGQINSSVSFANGKIKIGEDLSIAHTTEAPLSGDHNTVGLSGFGSTSVITNAAMQTRLPVYDTDGNFAGPTGTGFSDRNNPLHIAWLHRNNRVQQLMLFGNAYLLVQPVKNLSLKSTFGIDYSDTERTAYEPKWTEGFLSRTTNFMEKSLGKKFNWTWSNTANYSLKAGANNNFDFLLGMEAISNMDRNILGHKEDFVDESLDFYQFSAATGNVTLTGTSTGHTLVSYFGKVNYTFSDRYLASATVRIDGSSRFGENNRFGVFPAFTLGWRINNEAFMRDVTFLSNLKLRAGYGVVGNQDIGDNARFGQYATNYGTESGQRITGTAYDISGANTGSLPSGYVRTQLENPDLKWESTTEYNIGVDFGFFKESVYGTVDLFLRETKDILTRPPYAAVMGEGASQYVNGATMENKGYEITLGHRGQSGKVKYNVNYSMSAFADKITYLPEAVISSYPGNGEKTILGRSTSSFFGYLTTGIFQTAEEAAAYKVEHGQSGAAVGRLIWADLDNNGRINSYDQDWLGTSLPKFEYGISAQIEYKNLMLSVFGQGVYGKSVNDTRTSTDFASGVGMNFGRRVLNAWSPTNTDSDIPALSLSDTNSETSRRSNYTITKGDYFKFKNITLSYNLPTSVLSKIRVGQARVFITAENAILIRPKGNDAYSGPDPETPGSVFPKPISFTFGLNFTM